MAAFRRSLRTQHALELHECQVLSADDFEQGRMKGIQRSGLRTMSRPIQNEKNRQGRSGPAGFI
jgi:hypothetical protein